MRYRDGNPYPIGCSAHLYSENGLDWTLSPIAASNASITFVGGASVDLFRQRPKVLLADSVNGKGSVITHLFHGAMHCGERQITGGRGSHAPQNHCVNRSWPIGATTTSAAAGSELGINAPTALDYSFTTVVPLFEANAADGI